MLVPKPSPAAKSREGKNILPQSSRLRQPQNLILYPKLPLKHKFMSPGNLPAAMPKLWRRSLPWRLLMAMVMAAKACRRQEQTDRVKQFLWQ